MKESFFPKEVLVVAVGIILIVGTLALTLLRPNEKPKAIAPSSFSENSEEIKFWQSVGYIQGTALQKDISNVNLIIFDLRDPAYYGLNHIPGSFSVTPDTIVGIFKEKDPIPQKIVLIDESGQTTNLRSAIEKLHAANVKNIQILAGGYASWNTLAYTTITWGDPDSIIDHSKVHAISVENAKKVLDDPQVVFLDLRPKAEYDKSHKEGSLNISLDSIEFSTRTIPQEKMIIVYGESPLESFQGGVRLFDSGYILAYTLNGGYSDIQ